MFDLRVGSAEEAPSLADGWATHVVSLIDPRSVPMPPLALRVLVLRFEDCECLWPSGPAASHVADGLAFTRDLGADDHLLVHCVAGLSRSTALATAILVQHGLPATEALAQIGMMQPDMWPNERICAYADDLLGTGGAIIAAIRAWQSQQIALLEDACEPVSQLDAKNHPTHLQDHFGQVSDWPSRPS